MSALSFNLESGPRAPKFNEPDSRETARLGHAQGAVLARNDDATIVCFPQIDGRDDQKPHGHCIFLLVMKPASLRPLPTKASDTAAPFFIFYSPLCCPDTWGANAPSV